jgi:hypothetical protein
MVIWSARDAKDRALSRGELGERLLAQSADRLTPLSSGLDDSGGPQATEMPRNERLGQPDVGDQLRDGGLALGQTTDDAQAVHVGHHLVESTQLAELFWLGDGRGDRAADPGA